MEFMQHQSSVPQPGMYLPRRSHLLQRHPLLVPLALLGGSILLGLASLFTDTLFPVILLFGIPSLPICLAIAAILGITGVLISIVSVIECFDRQKIRTTMAAALKEHCYAPSH